MVVAAGLAMAALAAACSSGGGKDGAADRSPRLNQVQILATHNSYHQEPPKAVLDAVAPIDAALPPTIEYHHPSLAKQLDEGVRGLELDVLADPDGGRYSHPKAVGLLHVPPPSSQLSERGFKVLHIQELDYGSSCTTFVRCLRAVRSWSEAHPSHVPLVIQIEAKDDPVPDPLHLGFVQPLPIDGAAFRALEGEIRSVFPTRDLLRPIDVQGDHPTLRAAVTAGDWQRVDAVRGRVMFVLDDHAAKRAAYRALHPGVADRLLFVDADPSDPDAAYLIRNDPVGSATDITALVRQGFMVRTRADADTVEARRGDHQRADAALSSGAQVITTDYERADPRYPSYVVRLPGGEPARCRPHRTGPCDNADLDDPAP
jgi:hypothetical protein